MSIFLKESPPVLECCLTCLSENKQNLSNIDATETLIELLGEAPQILDAICGKFCNNCVFQLEKFRNFKSSVINSIRSLEKLFQVDKQQCKVVVEPLSLGKSDERNIKQEPESTSYIKQEKETDFGIAEINETYDEFSFIELHKENVDQDQDIFYSDEEDQHGFDGFSDQSIQEAGYRVLIDRRKRIRVEAPTKGKTVRLSQYIKKFKSILPDMKQVTVKKFDIEFDNECSVCGLRNTNVLQYRDHVFNSHAIDTGGNTFVCKECKLEIIGKQPMLYHFDMHRVYEPPVKCIECDEKLSNIKDYKRHLDSHKFSGKQFKCPRCESSYCRLASLHFHFVRSHTKALMCRFCELIFELEEDYQVHYNAELAARKSTKGNQKPSTGQKRKRCERADIPDDIERSYKQEYSLSISPQFKKIDNKKPLQKPKKNSQDVYCSVCNKYVDVFKTHVTQTHCTRLDDGRFQCKLCESILKDNYSVHFSQIHRQFERPEKCPHCPFQTINYEPFRKHMMDHKRLEIHGQKQFICHFCNATYNLKTGLRFHIFNKHTNSQVCKFCNKIFDEPKEFYHHVEKEKSKRNQKKLMCDICGFQTSHYTYIKDHVKRVHGEVTDAVACDICGKVCKSMLNMQDHKRNVHGEKNEICPQCGRKFRTPAFLREHIKITHSIEIVSCTICSKQCTKRNLKRHMFMVHDAQRPYQCKLCHMNFKIKAGLQKHLHTHSGTRPFNCHLCDQGFYHRELLAKHYTELHKVTYSREEIRQLCKRMPSKFEISHLVKELDEEDEDVIYEIDCSDI